MLDPRALADIGSVVTVHGPVPADELGVTLAHEHLMAVHQGPLVDTVDPESALEEMVRAVRFGVRTVVDMTDIGLGRDPRAIRTIASRSRAQIVIGTGFYKDGWLPAWVHELDVAGMADRMVSEILHGADDTDIRCGVIGEVGVSRAITATEERSLAASAHAQRRTGVAINVHFDIGAQAPEYHHALDILASEGADMRRVVVDHFVCRPDEVELALELTARGPLIEFDLWGMETWPKIFELTGHIPPQVQISSLAWFIHAGLTEQLLLSHDVANIANQRRGGGHGQSYIVRTLHGRFKEYGVTDDDLNIILVENPRRLLTVAPVAAAMDAGQAA